MSPSASRSVAPIPPAAIEEYLQAQPPAMRQVLQELRARIRAAAPHAEEVISYRMPAFRTEQGVLVCYAGFRDHGSLFPGALAHLTELRREVAPFAVATGTLRFTVEHPLPARLVARIVRAKLRAQGERTRAANSSSRRRPARRPAG